MLRTHSVTVSGNDLCVILNGSNNICQSVELGKVLFGGFFNIWVLVLLLSLFGLSFLALLSFFSSRGCLLSCIALNIDKDFVRIAAEQLCIKIRAQTIMLNQQIRQLLELEIIGPLIMSNFTHRKIFYVETRMSC